MPQRGADEGSVDGHLGHPAVEVVAVLAAVAGDVRGEDFLEGGEGAGGEHFGAEGVGLQLLQVGLWGGLLVACWRTKGMRG